MRQQIKVLALILVAVGLLAVMVMTGPANAAPAAAPTPVVYSNNSYRAVDTRNLVFFSGTPIAVTTPQRVCFDDMFHSTVDLEYITTVAAGVNTSTIILEHSNDNTNYVAGATVLSANATPQSALQQFALFGRYQCAKVTLANATPVAVTIIGVAK
jgi:hypothetical protein